jgi:hypothetical protein
MQTFPQLHNATSELLARLADVGIQLTGNSEGSSLQHVNAFWKSHADILERHRNAMCNVAVLGLTKAGEFRLEHPFPSDTCHCPQLLGGAIHFACARCVAGKSTLLNALIGARILPTSNIPETARITRLRHAPDCMEPVLTGINDGHRIVGATAVHERLELLNRQVREAIC